MQKITIEKLEFHFILEQLSERAVSKAVKEKLLLLTPFLEETQCRFRMNETTEALKIMNLFGTPPLSTMEDLQKILDLAEKGSLLMPQQLTVVSGFVSACKRMKRYLKKAEEQKISLGLYGASFYEMEELYEEIEKAIRYDKVDDGASTALRDIRRKIETANAAIRIKLDTMLRSKKEWFSDGYVVTRNNRLVLPVKKEYKHQIQGVVVDRSSTGSTYFIEPAAVGKLQEEVSFLQLEEENEVRNILYYLTALIGEQVDGLKINKDGMEVLDYAFAKAKLSMEMKAIPVEISTKREIKIKNGRHPLLNPLDCVPLNFEIGGEISGVIITGPNTGGKTVALKTVGLLSLMAQSGLHVPVEEGSIFCMHNEVLCDIGDGQSITENLSTFSAHIKNIVEILSYVTKESLVLLDELGSGTDPTEGMGLAISILEELREKGCLVLATTHYPEIKDYAKETEGLVNARMAFDKESLKPLYQLQIGSAGESCALYIAKCLGFPAKLLNRARQEAYGRTSTRQQAESFLPFEETKEKKELPSKVKSKIKKEKPEKEVKRCETFQIGDSVTVYPQKEIGIVCKVTNEKGELGVQIKGKKQLVNHKRLKLLCSASELYPDDYDFSILFDSVTERKARHQMSRKHDENLVLYHGKDEASI